MTIRVNAVTEDAVLSKHLKQYGDRYRTLDIVCSASPLPEHETDAYVVPISAVEGLLTSRSRPPTWLPVLVHGLQGQLQAAFLAGASDFLKEPWTVEELDLRVHRLTSAPAFALPWGKVQLFDGGVESQHARVALSTQEVRICGRSFSSRAR